MSVLSTPFSATYAPNDTDVSTQTQNVPTASSSTSSSSQQQQQGDVNANVRDNNKNAGCGQGDRGRGGKRGKGRDPISNPNPNPHPTPTTQTAPNPNPNANRNPKGKGKPRYQPKEASIKVLPRGAEPAPSVSSSATESPSLSVTSVFPSSSLSSGAPEFKPSTRHRDRIDAETVNFRAKPSKLKSSNLVYPFCHNIFSRSHSSLESRLIS